jgi:hypothetical protein
MIAVHAMTLAPMFTVGSALLAWFSLHQRMSAIDFAVADASTSTPNGWMKREVLPLPGERTVSFQAGQEGKPQIRAPAV